MQSLFKKSVVMLRTADIKEKQIINSELNEFKMEERQNATKIEMRSLDSNDFKIDKEIKNKSEQTIAGFFDQLRILLWKNTVLFKRNIFGTLSEVLFPTIFVLLLLIMRYLVGVLSYPDQTARSFNAIDPLINFNFTTMANTNTSLILYYPNNNLIGGIVHQAVNVIKLRNANFNPIVSGTSFSDGTKFDNATLNNLTALISFPSTYTTSLPDNIQYTIYTQELNRYTYKTDTNFVSKLDYMFNRPPEFYCFDTTYFYLYRKFNAIKAAIDISIISNITNTNVDPNSLIQQQIPCIGFNRDEFKARFSFFFPIIIAICFVFTVLVNIGNMITEKETKMKEYLKLVGVRWYIIWITWFLRSMIIYTIISLFFSIIGIIPINPRPGLSTSFYTAITGKIFTTTEFQIIFLTLIVYSIQVSSFILLISQIFSKSFIAKVVTILFWIATAINFYDNLPSSSLKYIFCMFPNTGLIFAIQVIFQYERSSKPLNFLSFYSNIFDDTLYLGGILASMFGYSLIYLPIAWYIEKVSPGEYGVPLPFYFPFMPSYWIQKQKVRPFDSVVQNASNEYGFEKEPETLRPTVCIQNLCKDFKIGLKTKRVVNNLSINFYENQITGFLGHNGAGKTTTTFMLCGIYPPTDGTAKILGFDIVTEMDKIRSRIGFCPQYNILYDDLYVEEHLKLVAQIKGFPASLLSAEIERITTFVGLQKDLKTKSKALSGGMKRRLQVAMALIGDAKIIILDEPTSGLDPFNRRSLWELIRKYKEGHTIIITTHFMDEADALSDRIAIMNHGEAKCCGSPLFLKELFGSGYRLTLSKKNNFDEQLCLKIFKDSLKNFKIESNIAAEICVAIPYDCSGSLPNLLLKIDNEKDKIGIESYGISSSTIEEVFLKVGRIDKNETNIKDAEISLPVDDLSNVFSKEFNKNKKFSLWFEQLQSLFYKRLLIFIRRYFLALIILLLPLLFEAIITAIIPSSTNTINTFANTKSSIGTYKLTIDNYPAQKLLYYLNGSISTTNFRTLLNNIYSQSNRPLISLQEETSDVSQVIFDLRKKDIKNMVNNYYVALGIHVVNTTSIVLTSYYSTLAYHSSANILNEASNLLLAFKNGYSTNKTITTFNGPIPSDNSLYSVTDFLELLACLDTLPLTLLNFLNSVIVGLIIALLVMHIGRERNNGSKSLQLLSGTHFSIYWLSNYLFDFIVVLFNITSMTVVLKIVDSIKNDPTSETYVIASDSNLGYFWLLLFFSCFSWMTVAYIWSFLFKSEIIGFVILALILGLAAFVDVVFAFLELNFLDDVNALNIMRGARWIFIFIFPNVTVKRGLFNLKTRTNSYCISQINSLLKNNLQTNSSPLATIEPGIGIMLIMTVVQFLIGNLILFLIETKFGSCKRKKLEHDNICFDEAYKNLDSDVSSEIKRINKSDLLELSKSEPLVVSNLQMVFKKKKKDFVAVNNLSFGVREKECFGLLGLNGAGKTTTFTILTGELDATNGNAYINGHDLSKDRSQARNNLGFCPQFDKLPEYLTVEQSLILFAKIRGLENETIKNVTGDLIRVFKLDEFVKKQVQDLSGGNKRKVSAAIAFLGRPRVVILDEPTTGMDPAARRYLWTVITNARDLGMTIILTSHALDECEALCNRLGIMVNGQFQCLGSIQHLKSKFGNGYSIIIKINSHKEDDAKILMKFMSDNFKLIKLKDKQEETFFYQIDKNVTGNSKELTIAEIFSLIEKNKKNLKIETYSVSQTTLEEVFMSFARLQKDADENNNSLTETNQKSIKENQKNTQITNRLSNADKAPNIITIA